MNKWALSLVKNVARVEQLRMFASGWFQAEGAATENEWSAGTKRCVGNSVVPA